MPFLPEWRAAELLTLHLERLQRSFPRSGPKSGETLTSVFEYHRNLSPDEAIILAREIEPFRILDDEDPVAPQSLQALQDVAAHVNIPIAFVNGATACSSSRIFSTRAPSLINASRSFARRRIHTVQENSRMRRGVLRQHLPPSDGKPGQSGRLRPVRRLFPNYAIMESGSCRLDEIVDTPLAVESGFVTVPDRPGIGITLRENVLGKFPYRPHKITTATRGDGSVAH